jgi:hypothetical protein
MKFALLALLLNHGQTNAYVIDYNLTADDCRVALHAGLPTDLPSELAAKLKDAKLVCEAETD